MGKPYSLDLRERVVAAVVTGGLSRKPGGKSNSGWASALRSTGCGGCVTPAAWRRARSAATSRRRFRAALASGYCSGIKDGDFTLRGLVAELAGRGLKVTTGQSGSSFHAGKLSFKKSVVAGERGRPDVAAARAQWTKYSRSHRA